MPASKTTKTDAIDARILRLLGLEDVFDLDYDTYSTLLKEALVKYGVIGKDKIPTEEIELLRDEFKRVKGKTGRVKVKSKKINAKNVTGLKALKEKKIVSSPKLLPGTAVKPKEEDQKKEEEKKPKEKAKPKEDALQKLVSSIKKSVDSIAQSVKGLSKVLDKSLAADKRRAENERRSEKEKGLESGAGAVISKVASAIIKPFESIFDKIFNFIFWTLLGNTFFKILDWFNDPKNQKKIGSIFRFLKDWWPAILTGFLAFATPLGGFIATITGTLIRGLFMLARINPALTAAIALFGAGAAIPMLFPKTVDEQERKTEEAPGTPEEKIEKLKNQKENLNWFQKNVQGMGSEIDEQIHRLETGETKSYANGGRINFAKGGKVRSNSGVRISGAGPDTQLIAAQPGEVVINKRTVDAVGANNLLALNSAYGGANANKPKFAGNIRAAKLGGLIQAFKDGGYVGDKEKPDKTLGEHEKELKKIDEGSKKYTGGQRSSSNANQISIEKRIKRIESQLQAQKALASGKGINIKGAQLGSNIGTGYGAKYKGRDAVKVKLPAGGSYESEITLAGKRYYAMKQGNDIIYVAQDPRDKNGGGFMQPGGLFGGPRMSARSDYAASKGKYYSSSDQKTYGNYNDAVAARQSRLTSLASQQRLNKLSFAGASRNKSRGVRIDAQDEAARAEVKARGGAWGQISRGWMNAFGSDQDRANIAAQDKASQARVKQAGAAAIGRYYSSSDGKYYANYAAAEAARKKRLANPPAAKPKPKPKYKGAGAGGVRSSKKQGGGPIEMFNVGENSGYDVPGGGADRQFIPGVGFLHPGEKLVALTKDAVDRGAADMVDSLNAKFDSNSNAWKKGGVYPLPATSTGGKMLNLPPEVLDMRPKPSSPGNSTEAETLDTTPSFGAKHRSMIKKAYGIG